MDNSSQEKEEKKKITNVKTFPVPFTLEEIKKNISITTKIPSQPSKDQLIQQAIQFHSQGNIYEAGKYYKRFLDEGFKDHRVFSNYGIILKSLGKLKEAKSFYNKAIEIKPDFADAHYNLGIILSDLGKLIEAEISTRKAIQLNPSFANAHCNLGSILSDLGKFYEAEISTRKAIELNPNYSEAYSNLGNILRNLGKLLEAEISTRKAIELDSNYAEAHYNLGSILSDLGKLREAEISIKKAIEIKPDFAEAYYNLGIILSDLFELQKSFDSYIKVIEINPKFSNIYPSITRFISDSDVSELNKSKLKEILNILLEKSDVPHKELFKAFKFVYSNEMISNLEKLDSDFSEIELLVNNKVIINALKKITFKDIRIEKLLTKARKNICLRIAENIEPINCSELQFIIALGEQCFINEYIYSLTDEEELSLNQIIYKCKDREINETYISILACYFPLHKLFNQIPALKSFNPSNQSLKELLILQISEPLKEIDLSKNIKQLGSIDNKISRKVKSQYEKNPYPRWRYGNPSNEKKLSFTQVIDIEIKPNSINKNRYDQKSKVLIAGCGTGNQILQSQRYKNAHITCIDLSLSSLSYAQRKINELGINNIELIEMDILDVSLLEKKFDIIECGGVLHHMDNPSKGLKELLGVLKNNGFLKLGVYSELARKDIVKAREYISTNNLQPNDEDIKDFREDVFSGKIEQISNLRNWGNFYTMSECRDLCFHTQEHRFTINQLQAILQSNELKFLGFLLPKQIKSVYKQYFPEDKNQTNLQNWGKFEEKHPHTFRGMYQFWVCKI